MKVYTRPIENSIFLYFSINPSPYKLMNTMLSLHARFNAHASQIHVLQEQLSYVISQIHSQGASSSALPYLIPDAQIVMFSYDFVWSRFWPMILCIFLCPEP